MACDLWTGKRTNRDWSLGAAALPTGLTERRISSREQAPRAALAFIPREFLYAPDNNSLLLERSTLTAFIKLFQAARAAGFPNPLFRIVSGFRSFRAQELLWQKALWKYGSPEKARIWVAPPGGSTHATGRAVDLWLGMACDSRNVAALRATKAYGWLMENAWKFGFYPYLAEPWHWEYNPREGEASAAGLPMPASGVPKEIFEEAGDSGGGVTALLVGGLLLAAVGGSWYATRKSR